MKPTPFLAIAAAISLARADQPAAPEPPAAPPQPKPVVDVVFVLDSTGSMGGLIEGAKDKIWSIANSVIGQKPAPSVRIGLVSYRDRGDEYVTRSFDLTDDIDEVFKNLRSFRASGGGDTPESVNQALHEAVGKMGWSAGKDATKIMFLVGDCPPHMDYQDDVKYQETCKRAASSGIVINTVQCGGHSETTPVWQEIARLAEGSYIALAQTGGMVAVSTPHDAEIARLSAELGETAIAYGDAAQQSAVRQKNAAAKDAAPSVAAERAAYNSKSGGKAVQGRGDLLADLEEGKVKLESVKQDELPAEFKGKSPEEQQKLIGERQTKRAELNKQLADLATKRDAFIAQEKNRLKKEGKGDAFDLKVEETIRKQTDKSNRK
ncbi:MAG: VWA domain-containing protein [Verrucomicrobia bacterium]|nr:VWA domain-containing protein [Verrucomicrobiota bacterium]